MGPFGGGSARHVHCRYMPERIATPDQEKTMYAFISSLAVAVLVGAVVYEVRRQNAAWNEFHSSLERLTCSRR